MLSALPLSATLMTIIGCPLTCPSSAPAAYRPRQSSAPQPRSAHASSTFDRRYIRQELGVVDFVFHHLDNALHSVGRRAAGGRREA